MFMTNGPMPPMQKPVGPMQPPGGVGFVPPGGAAQTGVPLIPGGFGGIPRAGGQGMPPMGAQPMGVPGMGPRPMGGPAFRPGMANQFALANALRRGPIP